MIKAFILWLAKVFTIILIIILFGYVADRAIKKEAQEALRSKAKIGVVEISGVITDSLNYIKKLKKFFDDKSIVGVILRVDSPGGAVGPSQEIFNFIKTHKRKPVVASFGTLAASGGLYASLGADKIVAQPGTLTGSIGVIIQIPNVSNLLNKFGVEMTTIKSGELKDVGNMFRPMSSSEVEFLKNAVSEIHNQFIDDIVSSRGLDREAVKAFADGRFLSGKEAVAVGLVDQLGDIYVAAQQVLILANQENKEPVLVFPKDYTDIIEAFLQGVSNYVLKLFRVYSFESS
jgi:protease-4